MTDLFALLGQERRPRPDEAGLKASYLDLTRRAHPDLTGERNFDQVNEAYRVVSSPRRRLLHLLALEGAAPISSVEVAPELAAMFSKISEAEEKFRRMEGKAGAATSSLSKAVLANERAALRSFYAGLAGDVADLQASLSQELEEADDRWDTERAAVLAELPRLASRLSFVERWQEQLSERLLGLADN